MGNAAKRLINITLLEASLSFPDWARGIGIYGSWARGTNTIESDLDLWIIVKNYHPDLEFTIAEFEHNLSNTLECEVHSLILTKEKLKNISKEDPPFYSRLMNDTITLMGENLDTT